MKFNRIWIKAFLILALINLSLTFAVYLFSLWSLDRSLAHYNTEPQPIQQVRNAIAGQQKQSFLLLSIGLLGASALGALGFARWLGRSLDPLAQGTRALAQGDYSVRLGGHHADKLGQLVRDFNALAQTLEASRDGRREWLVNITQELRMPLSVMLGEIEAMRGWIVDAAHELRTPLTVILGEIEAVEDGIHSCDAEWVQRIGQKTRQLSARVNDLHQLALTDQGALVYHKTRVDFGALLREYLDSSLLTLNHVGLQVDLAISEDLPVWGDVDRLRQLLCNLLQNTLRYTDAPGSLRICASRVGGMVLLRWEDSAPGVPAAALDQLTDRLYRGEDSRSRASGGSGLGLSIAKAIVDAHGGSMQPSASGLGGLCWNVQLPLEPVHDLAATV